MRLITTTTVLSPTLAEPWIKADNQPQLGSMDSSSPLVVAIRIFLAWRWWWSLDGSLTNPVARRGEWFRIRWRRSGGIEFRWFGVDCPRSPSAPTIQRIGTSLLAMESALLSKKWTTLVVENTNTNGNSRLLIPAQLLGLQELESLERLPPPPKSYHDIRQWIWRTSDRGILQFLGMRQTMAMKPDGGTDDRISYCRGVLVWMSMCVHPRWSRTVCYEQYKWTTLTTLWDKLKIINFIILCFIRCSLVLVRIYTHSENTQYRSHREQEAGSELVSRLSLQIKESKQAKLQKWKPKWPIERSWWAV